MADNVRHTPDPVAWDCPHFELGPPDEVGLQVCKSCGQLVLQTIADMTVEEFEAQTSTVKAEEGADVHLPERGETEA